MIVLYTPEYHDLWFRRNMMEDPQTMSYNHAWGGTIPFPEENWQDWYDRWIIHHENRRYYRYLQDETGTFLGEIAWHFEEKRNIHLCDIIIAAPYRGKGYGRMALQLLCIAAKENGIKTLYDEIAADNTAIGLFLKSGFEEEYRTDQTVMLKKEL